MIYILGGVARSGKSIVAEKLLKEKGVPYFALDYLKMGLFRGLSESAFDPEKKSEVIARNIWPIVKGMVKNMIEVDENYLIEGDILLPSLINELLIDPSYKNSIRVCFVGYSEIDREEKFKLIRSTRGSSKNNWIQGMTDDFILKFAQEQIDRSNELKKECAEYGIKYIDTSSDFDNNLNKIIDYFVSN